MAEKYLLFSLDDEKSKKLGEVISNLSCKKIANLLAEKEASASEIASELKMPLNSAMYSIKKLIGAGIIERKGGFFWSSKGKKIEKYKIANKLIVISPKKTNVYSKLGGIVPAALISAAFTGIVAWYYKSQTFAQGVQRDLAQNLQEKVASESLTAVAPQVMQIASQTTMLDPWIWFALGGLIMLVVFLIWNWKKL